MTNKSFKRSTRLLQLSLAASLGLTPLLPIAAVAAAPAAPVVYLQDDFSDGDYTANPAWTVASGSWKIASDPVNSANQALNQTDTGEGIITTGDTNWTDSTVTMRFYTGGGGAYPGILARVQDSRNFYYFQMQTGSNLVLSKRVNGTDTVLKSISYTLNKNTWYTLKLVLVGSSIKGYIVNNGADKLVFDVVDTTYSTGKIGIRNKWQSVYLDDVKVTNAPAANTSVLQSDAQTGSTVSLNWTPVGGASGYNIYRSTTSGSGYSYIASSTANSYVDTGLVSDTAYYYKIAYTYGGLTESQWSSELPVKTALAPPAAPASPTATAVNSSTVNLSWSGATKAAGYRVYRSSDAGSSFSMIYEGTALSFLDTGLTPITAYSYRITAYNQAGESAPASTQATTYLFDAPGNLQAGTTTDTSVALSWNPVQGSAVTYNLVRASSQTGTYYPIYSGSEANFTDTGLTMGTGYFYKISAMIDGISTPASAPYGVGTIRTAITPGTVWADLSGNPIDAHGPGIMFDDKTQKYYWYGEYHTGGWPATGVRVYSSTDLYNWTDEGMALTTVKSMDDFTNDPLISKLYAGRTDIVSIWADIRAGRIIERPKVIYNDKTKKYVMWAHIDGDKDPYNNNANYGKAQAGYAISDSPTGPFIYQKSYRMDQCPPDQTDYQPGNPGMARDMNLFKDDDGTAYLIYSSEENLTMYISKLLDDYSDVTGWHKDGKVDENGNPVRDSSYKAVYGEDYVRVFPGGQREAPAVFKYDGKYYMLTSGATGWAPNLNKFSVADSMFGTWSTPVNPFVRASSSDPDPATAFKSQTASVIPVDPAKGKFIYVGDDWNGGNFANHGAKYVWLPIEFGQGSDITIKWYGSWTTDLLNNMGKMDVSLKLPEVIGAGTALDLPNQLEVKPSGAAASIITPVTWTVNSQPVTVSTFALPGVYSLQAALPAFNNKTLIFKIYAVPAQTIYFVNSGGYKTGDYTLMGSYMQNTLMNKDTVEQAYSTGDAIPWGYVGTKSNPAGSASGDIFSTLRYLNGGNVTNSPAGTDLTYKFTVPNGSYTVYTGFNDIWSNTSRKADLYINGVKKTAITYISNKVYSHTVEVTDGTIDVTVRNTAAQDPLINWIMIADNTRVANDPLLGFHISDTTSDSATLSWNKVLGATTYTLYRAAGADGAYTPVYQGSEAAFTDNGIDPALTYSYKVSYTGLSGESPMSDSVSIRLDQTKPVTALDLAGSSHNGWYNSGVTVTLTGSDDLSGVARTEYKLGDNEAWTAYSGPFTLTEDGAYTLQYRSIDRAGYEEELQQQSFKVDATLPAFTLTAGGIAIGDGEAFDDDQELSFQAADGQSGLVSAQITVNGSVYGVDPVQQDSSVIMDFTGKPGSYTAVITALDEAGNKLQEEISFEVTTSIRSMNMLLSRYQDEFGSALLAQLSNSLKQAQQQLDINRPDQAAKHMEDFLKHLENKAIGVDVAEEVKAVLTADAAALIKKWSDK